MSERNRNIAQTKLALAIAEGTSIALWAKDNGVPRRTAYRWAKEPKVQAVVAFCRRGAVDRGSAGWPEVPTGWSTKLPILRCAESELVRLRALQATLFDTTPVSQVAGLEHRISQIETQLREGAGPANPPGF